MLKLHKRTGTMKLMIVASLIVGLLPLHLPTRAKHQLLDCRADNELWERAWCPASTWIFQSSWTCCWWWPREVWLPLWSWDQAQMYLHPAWSCWIATCSSPGDMHLAWPMHRTSQVLQPWLRLDASFMIPWFLVPFRSLPSVVHWSLWDGSKQDELSFPGDFSASLFTVACWLGWCWCMIPRRPRKTTEWNQGHASQMGMLALMVHGKFGNLNNLLPP